MPVSDPRVRAACLELIQARGLTGRVLDLGVGAGFYGMALTQLFPGLKVYGVEIWPPYITPDHLTWYDEILLADLRAEGWKRYLREGPELVVAGDVLEHLERDEAVVLVDAVQEACGWLLATIPIQRIEQGPYQGNVHETHRYHWSAPEVIETFGMTLVADCGFCGLFEWRREP